LATLFLPLRTALIEWILGWIPVLEFDRERSIFLKLLRESGVALCGRKSKGDLRVTGERKSAPARL